MSPDAKVPRFFQSLLILAVVLGPIYWLMFTADGQRRTDMALMSILGRPPFDAALGAFTGRLTEGRLRESFPALELQCADGPNPFGDRLCAATIGSFNQYPARSVAFYFLHGWLSAVKVSYQPAYHRSVRGWVERHLGPVAQGAGRAAPEMRDGVASFSTADGILVLKDGALGQADEPALLWLSRSTLESPARGAGD